jgi:hypothetical protein
MTNRLEINPHSVLYFSSALAPAWLATRRPDKERNFAVMVPELADVCVALTNELMQISCRSFEAKSDTSAMK